MPQKISQRREGAVSIFMSMLLVPLLFLLAFSIDYGFLLHRETDLQRVADQAVLAATRDLVPASNGYQDLDKVKATLRDYVEMNLGSEFIVSDNDIEIGRYNPATVYTGVELLSDGILDTVRVTLRYDSSANGSITLYFAKLLGHEKAAVIASSTAALQKGAYMAGGADVFPFVIHQTAWGEIAQGEMMTIYGDGRLEDGAGNAIPGNWGTVDIGAESNSQSALSSQIEHGLTQDDVNSLYQQGRIATNEYIDASQTIDLNGDTGLSAGLKHALSAVEGQTRIAPIYSATSSHGGNLEFTIVGWGSVKVLDSQLKGGKKSYVKIEKSYLYDENLRPKSSLSDSSGLIEGAYTTPTLLE